MRRFAFVLVLAFLPSVACSTPPRERDQDALAFMAVKAAIDPNNTLGISKDNILTKANPKGAGEFVYASANLVSRYCHRDVPARTDLASTAVAPTQNAGPITPMTAAQRWQALGFVVAFLLIAIVAVAFRQRAPQSGAPDALTYDVKKNGDAFMVSITSGPRFSTSARLVVNGQFVCPLGGVTTGDVIRVPTGNCVDAAGEHMPSVLVVTSATLRTD